jgi:hypothetical protein
MQETDEDPVRRLQERETEQIRQATPPPPGVRTVPYTALAEAPADGPLATEWNSYRRQVGHLLAEDNQGKWVFIQGERIVGIWDTRRKVESRGGAVG